MNFEKKDYIGLILLVIGLFYLLLITYIGFNNWGVWFDEVFSFKMVRLPLNEMITLGISDVHPLLYYFIFKVFYKLLSPLNIALIGIIVSLIPLYLLAILSVTKIRKNFSLLVSGIFMLCIFAMPQLIKYSLAIRMYSWGLFFLTASFLYVYLTAKNPGFKNWAVLTVLTVCSIHTHYFATLTSFVLYGLFLIYIVRNNRDLLKGWLISALISTIAFLPWLPYLLVQITRVRSSFWIPQITLSTIPDYIVYPFVPNDMIVAGFSHVAVTDLAVGAVFLIATLFLIYYSFRKDNLDKFTVYGISTVVLVPLIGIVISVLMKPIFYQRYMVLFLGIFYLSLSILVAKTYENRKVFYVLIAILLVVSIFSANCFVLSQESDNKITVDKFNQLHAQIEPGVNVYVDDYETFILLDSFFLESNNITLINSSDEITPDSYFFDCNNLTEVDYNRTELDIKPVPFIDTCEFKVYKIGGV